MSPTLVDMKVVLAAYLLAFAACSSNPQRQDLDMFCSADAMANGATLPAVGEYVLAHAHAGTEVAKSFTLAKNGQLAITELAQVIGVLLDAEHIVDCPTYAKMWGAFPHAPR